MDHSSCGTVMHGHWWFSARSWFLNKGLQQHILQRHDLAGDTLLVPYIRAWPNRELCKRAPDRPLGLVVQPNQGSVSLPGELQLPHPGIKP